MSDLNWQPLGRVQCVCGYLGPKFGGRYPLTQSEAEVEMQQHPCTEAVDE